MLTSLAQLTPDSLLSLPEPAGGGHYELSDGELIVVGNAGALHELVKSEGTRLAGEQLLTSDRLPDFSVAVSAIFAHGL